MTTRSTGPQPLFVVDFGVLVRDNVIHAALRRAGANPDQITAFEVLCTRHISGTSEGERRQQRARFLVNAIKVGALPAISIQTLAECGRVAHLRPGADALFELNRKDLAILSESRSTPRNFLISDDLAPYVRATTVGRAATVIAQECEEQDQNGQPTIVPIRPSASKTELLLRAIEASGTPPSCLVYVGAITDRDLMRVISRNGGITIGVYPPEMSGAADLQVTMQRTGVDRYANHVVPAVYDGPAFQEVLMRVNRLLSTRISELVDGGWAPPPASSHSPSPLGRGLGLSPGDFEVAG